MLYTSLPNFTSFIGIFAYYFINLHYISTLKNDSMVAGLGIGYMYCIYKIISKFSCTCSCVVIK